MDRTVYTWSQIYKYQIKFLFILASLTANHVSSADSYTYQFPVPSHHDIPYNWSHIFSRLIQVLDKFLTNRGLSTADMYPDLTHIISPLTMISDLSYSWT